MKTLLRDGADFQYSAEAQAARWANRIQAGGYFTETCDRGMPTSIGALTSGSLQLSPFGVAKGDLISGFDVDIGTAGATLTLVKACLLDVNGNRLGVSADVSAAMTTTGTKQIPLTTPYRVADEDTLLAGFLAVGTTPPGPVRTSGIQNGIAPGGRISRGGTVSGQTDIQATNTITWASTTFVIWMGVY